MSLRARLLLLVLLATLLPALLVGWRFFRDSDVEIRKATQSLALAVESLAAELDHRVQGTAQLEFGLARAGVLDSGDRHACSAYLAEVREAYPQYTGILTVRPDGELFCDSLQSERRLNLSDRTYFKRALQGDSAPLLQPVSGRLTGNTVLQIVYPAHAPGGALRFLLVASLNLQKFVEDSALQSLQSLPARPEVLLVDHAGTVMVASGAALAALKPGVSIAGSALFGLAQAQAAGGVGELTGGDGPDHVWAVAGASVAREAGLYLMLGVARPDLVADARLRLRQALLTLAAIATLLFAGVFQLAEWGIRRQVDRITSMARRLGNGDLSARIEPPYPRGEMGGLMAVLNSTAASLQHQRDEIDTLGLRLRQAQKLEALGTMAGGIAHDFNNILGAILGNLSLASEEALTGQPTQHSLQQIRRAALRARDLVQRIQAFSRPDLPATSVQLLRPIVDEVLALAAVALPAGVQLQSELTTEPLRVRADATQLHQVLMNLCTNATQALQGEPGTVTVGLQGVVFGDGTPNRPPGLARGHYAHLWVRDTGCGIADADRDRIFEPFFTTKGAQGGTGLGLSAVHGIVGAHGGTVSLESRSGAGSTFHIHLPALADTVAPGDATGAAAALPVAAPGHGEHIVYIDDDEVMALMVERLLQRAGYRASCHVSARAALAAVRADPQGCDLVVTDFNMPELSGLDVSRELAALRPGLPVLIMSGYVFDELPAQAQRAGVREVIRKQNVLDDLVPAIARALATAMVP